VAPTETKLTWLEGMAAKREQWAAAWTWAHLTFGIHSTQRIEAIHSSIQEWCRNSSLLINFFKSMESREALRKQNSETKAHRDTFKNVARGAAVWPPVAKLGTSLTAYAFELQCAQAREMLNYTATPSDDDPDVFIVKRVPGTFSRAPIAPVVRSGASASDDALDTRALVAPGADEAFEAEHGLGSDPAPRRTSVSKCSCQLTPVLGLVCRHRLLVMQLKQFLELPSDELSAFWRAGPYNELAPRPSYLPAAPAPAAALARSDADREAALMPQVMALVKVARTREGFTKAFERSMQQQLRAMRLDTGAVESDDDADGPTLVPNPTKSKGPQHQKRLAAPAGPGAKKKSKAKHKAKPF
jgi:hypothetical protein